MTEGQITQVAALASVAEELGLTIVGGVKALAGVFGHTPTDAEADAIEDAILVEASKRSAERNRMAGGDATTKAT